MKTGIRVFLAVSSSPPESRPWRRRARADGGKAEGTITVNGKTTKLSYAYARAVKGFFDKTKEDVEVVLSDVPLEGKALEDQFERMHMADAGKLHAFEITIDAEGKPISTAFRHNGFKGPSPSGLSSDGRLHEEDFDGKTVDARYKSAKESRVLREHLLVRRRVPRRHHARGQARAADRRRDGRRQKSPQAKVYAEFLSGRPEGRPRGAPEALHEGAGEEPRQPRREEDGRIGQDDVRDGHPGPEARREGRHGRAHRQRQAGRQRRRTASSRWSRKAARGRSSARSGRTDP